MNYKIPTSLSEFMKQYFLSGPSLPSKNYWLKQLLLKLPTKLIVNMAKIKEIMIYVTVVNAFAQSFTSHCL